MSVCKQTPRKNVQLVNRPSENAAYNNGKTPVESTRAMIRERGSRAESKNCEILLFPTADRRFDTKVNCPTGRASFWVKFPAVRS